MASIKRRDFIKTSLGAATGLVSGCTAGSFMGFSDHGTGKSPINLLFIMTDQQRWDALSRAGNKILSTPNLDRLAREGAYFENAYTACPVCVPARTSMLTGCGIQTTGIRNNTDFRREGYCQMPTFDNILASRGYRTEYFGKWHGPIWRAMDYKSTITQAGIHKTVLGPGFSIYYRQYLDKHVPKRKLKQGEREDMFSLRPYIPDPLDIGYGLGPEELPKNKEGKPIKRWRQCDAYGQLLIPAEHQPSALYADETIDALERCKDRPFSITCSMHHPHAPMIPTKPYYGMYPAKQMPIPVSIDDPMDNSPYAELAKTMTLYRDKSKIGYMISNYYGLVKEIDDHVGRILNKLKELDLEKNTLVIFTSDHGEMLGHHGMQEKAAFYEDSAHIPLIMRLPGLIPANTVVSQPVSQLNLFATILDYLGIRSRKSDGRSMQKLINGRDKSLFEYAVTEWDFSHFGIPNFMVRDKDWKFITHRDEKSENVDALYNLRDDPYEMNNLVGRNPQRAQSLKQARKMKDMLVVWLEKTDSPFLENVKRRPIS
ncbi:MAG: sulfatase-like hydrolase/transferase [Planctomycetota bacterium]|nr:MAG: sulfatase-like hydrolase/transferase [Planctomycetota bacterium]